MEAGLNCHQPCRHLLLPPPPGISPCSWLQSGRLDRPDHAPTHLMRDLRRLSANIITAKNRVQRDPQLFSVGINLMATTNNQPPESIAGNMRKEEEAKKKLRAPPPPPEKPEAGDCCGSGCVRCVWDVYYEELEEYNKLYGADHSSSENSSKAG